MDFMEKYVTRETVSKFANNQNHNLSSFRVLRVLETSKPDDGAFIPPARETCILTHLFHADNEQGCYFPKKFVSARQFRLQLSKFIFSCVLDNSFLLCFHF